MFLHGFHHDSNTFALSHHGRGVFVESFLRVMFAGAGKKSHDIRGVSCHMHQAACPQLTASGYIKIVRRHQRPALMAILCTSTNSLGQCKCCPNYMLQLE